MQTLCTHANNYKVSHSNNVINSGVGDNIIQFLRSTVVIIRASINRLIIFIHGSVTILAIFVNNQHYIIPTFFNKNLKPITSTLNFTVYHKFGLDCWVTRKLHS